MGQCWFELAAPCNAAVCLLTVLAKRGTSPGAFAWGVAT